MTVHAAKGLEWDVVVVAGLTRSPCSRSTASRSPTGPSRSRRCRSRCAATAPSCPTLPLAGRRRPGGGPRRAGRVPRGVQGAGRAGGAPAGLRRGDPRPRPAALLRLLVGHQHQAARPVGAARAAARPVRRGGGGVVAVWAERPPRPTAQPAERRARVAAAGRTTRWALRAAGASRTPRRLVRGARGGRRRPSTRRTGHRSTRGTTSSSCCSPSWPGTGSAAAPPPSSSCRRSCRCPSWSCCAATRPSWPGRSGGRCRASRRRWPVGAPGSTCGSRRAGGSSGCSTSTSCPAPPTTRPRPTTTCWRCRRRSRRASGPPATPTEVELPFDMVVDGLLLRGRCDAVFTDAPDGLVDVVDWKTGPPRTGAEARGRRRPAGRLPAGLAPPHRRAAGPHPRGVPLRRGAGSRSAPPTCSTRTQLAALISSVPTVPTG